MLAYFKHLNPRISVPLFYLYVAVLGLWRFLFRSVAGALTLALAIYFYIAWYTPTSPFNHTQIFDWLTQLPPEYKVALLTSLVTIAGFVVAFHTATMNWRHQMQAQLKVDAAGQIENFFNNVARNTITARLYAQYIIDSADVITAQPNTFHSQFQLHYIYNHYPAFVEARDALSEASIEVHRLIGRNHHLLSSELGSVSAAQAAAAALDQITDAMWFPVPTIRPSDENAEDDFLQQVDVQQCEAFVNTCNRNYDIVNAVSGGIQGQLLYTIWGFSLPQFIGLLINHRKFRDAVQTIHARLNGR